MSGHIKQIKEEIDSNRVVSTNSNLFYTDIDLLALVVKPL